MSDSSPDPRRRSIFRILTAPDAAGEFGRQLGRAFRELTEAMDPPTVPLEQYQQAVAQVTALQEQFNALKQGLEEHRDEVKNLLLEAAERDKQIVDAIEQNRAASSTSQRAQQDLARWQNLRTALWAILGGIVGATATALYEGWVQENLYPLVKGFPAWAQKEWTELLTPAPVQPPSPLESPLVPQPTSPLESPPTQPEAPRAQESYHWHSHDFDWVPVPAGYFLMGSDKSKDPQAYDTELPQHRLYLPAFRIARVPVTNAQYKLFVDATGYRKPSHWNNDGRIPTGKENHPVTYVFWSDAQAFCIWAGVCLPSEAEWEKAARGTDGRIYPWGNSPPTDKLCNFNKNVKDTTTVGSYPAGASPYGCLDMAGNVWELTSTRWVNYPYDSSDEREDLNSSNSFLYKTSMPDRRWLIQRRDSFGYAEAEWGESFGYAARGGSLYSNMRWVRCAARDGYDNIEYNLCGFRVVSSPGF